MIAYVLQFFALLFVAGWKIIHTR